MNTTFPFGFDTTTVFYLSLYLLTLVVHVFFMSYVLAGSLYLAWANVFSGASDVPRVQQPLACLLRDWMPFVLSAAITAGVAPLLFVQIIYNPHFYTANLLLGWRWMIVIPVLTAAFYLLYVVKSKKVADWSTSRRVALGVSTAACFLFVAFCWSANHLLSIDRSQWPAAYASKNLVASPLDLCLRLATWIAGTFPVMSILAAWQLAFRRISSEPNASQRDSEARRLAMVSLCGLLIGSVTASAYAARLPESSTQHLFGAAGIPWIALAVVGIVMQAAGWIFQWRNMCFCTRLTSMVTMGCLAMLPGVAILREIIRASRIDLASMQPALSEAIEIGGFGTFVVFAVLNTVLITICVRLVIQRNRSD